jgi:putative flippase GtrA
MIMKIFRAIIRASWEYLRLHSSIIFTFVRSNLAGAANTAFAYSFIFVLMYFVGLSPERSNFITYCVTLFSSYYLRKRYVFKSKGKTCREFPLFLLISAGCFICNLMILKTAISLFRINPYLAQALAGSVYVGVGFLGHKLLVFRHDTSRLQLR